MESNSRTYSKGRILKREDLEEKSRKDEPRADNKLHITIEQIHISYEAFVEEEIKNWTEKGAEWKYPQNIHNNNNDNDNKELDTKYTSEIMDHFIITVYDTITSKNKTSKFVKLLMLFTHQTVIGRIFASYLQIPEYLRNIHVNNKQFTTMALLCWQWNEKDGKATIPVGFWRVYLIFVTNYLNRIWQYYHIDLEKEDLKPEDEEYVHIDTIQKSLNEIIDSTEESTKNKTKLSKSIVFEKIAENACSLIGTMIDALRFKYKPINIRNLEQFYVVLSLIALQINNIFRDVEELWLNNKENYKKDRFKDKKGDENFVTLVLSQVDAKNEKDFDSFLQPTKDGSASMCGSLWNDTRMSGSQNRY